MTFTCGVPPDDDARLPALVRQIGNHRVAYLEYQGEVSGGRGWCKIHDRGEFEWVVPSPAACPAARVGETAHPLEDFIVISVVGDKMKGTYRLTREPKSGIDYWRTAKGSRGGPCSIPCKGTGPTSQEARQQTPVIRPAPLQPWRGGSPYPPRPVHDGFMSPCPTSRLTLSPGTL